ncbi:MAG: arginine--tRNA ligase [Candidatus Latescibacterota bacterium]|nr:MAG: arginine--tRNA ligase [Candidatus Latescibacterota bacterium]
MLRQRLETSIRETIRRRWPEVDPNEVRIEQAREKEHGDFAANAAFVLAKRLGRPPRSIAEELLPALEADPLVEKASIAGPGFLNLKLRLEAYHDLLAHILEAGDSFGRSALGSGCFRQIEFVSANPTGPLNIVSARAAAVGDALARLFEAAGDRVEREFYVNDHGSQVDHLVESVLWHKGGGVGPFPEEGYRGAYVEELARESESALGPAGPPSGAGGAAGPGGDRARLRAWLLERMIGSQEAGLQAFAVRFDRWFRESELHDGGEVERALEDLVRAGDVYEKDSARWFRSTKYGDDEDRVVVRSNGQPTYFLADVAYHRNKAARGYDHVIDILGPDHHGHVARMQAAVRSLGRPKDGLEVLIVQQVNLLRGGETVKMSKRAGEFVTLGDLVEEVGADAARFFFVMLRPNSHLNFDLDLAKKKSLDNPVYYVQYAHARISSVFAHARAAGIDEEPAAGGSPFASLTHEGEIELLRLLDAFPDAVAGAAATREPHRIPAYLRELASAFHTYYHQAKIVGEGEEVTRARLALAGAVRTVLRSGLGLLGVTAPESM